MKKFLFLSVFLVLAAACFKEPVRFVEEYTVTEKLNTGLDISKILSEDVEKNLVYDWDEVTMGKIGYTYPDSLVGYLIKSGSKEVNEVYGFGDSKEFVLDFDKPYGVLFHNVTQRTDYNFTESGLFCTPTGLNDTTRIVQNFEEQYSVYGKNTLGEIRDKVEELTNVYGKTSYKYTLEAQVEPVSYIYILQVIVYDDDSTVPMEISGYNYLALDGLAMECDIMNRQNTKRECRIVSTSLKPMQAGIDYLIFAERFVTYGLPKDASSSWNANDKRVCAGINFIMNSGEEVPGRVDITNQFINKPYGGVLTVNLKNSDIENSASMAPGDPFDIIVTPWDEYVFDIDF